MPVCQKIECQYREFQLILQMIVVMEIKLTEIRSHVSSQYLFWSIHYFPQ